MILKNHVIKVHQDVNFDKGSFVCEICEHSFVTLILMNNHIASFHEGKGGVISEGILNLFQSSNKFTKLCTSFNFSLFECFKSVKLEVRHLRIGPT